MLIESERFVPAGEIIVFTESEAIDVSGYAMGIDPTYLSVWKLLQKCLSRNRRNMVAELRILLESANLDNAHQKFARARRSVLPRTVVSARGGDRTHELLRERILSPPPLTAWLPSHALCRRSVCGLNGPVSLSVVSSDRDTHQLRKRDSSCMLSFNLPI